MHRGISSVLQMGKRRVAISLLHHHIVDVPAATDAQQAPRSSWWSKDERQRIFEASQPIGSWGPWSVYATRPQGSLGKAWNQPLHYHQVIKLYASKSCFFKFTKIQGWNGIYHLYSLFLPWIMVLNQSMISVIMLGKKCRPIMCLMLVYSIKKTICLNMISLCIKIWFFVAAGSFMLLRFSEIFYVYIYFCFAIFIICEPWRDSFFFFNKSLVYY